MVLTFVAHRVIDRLAPEVNFAEQLRKGNIAAGISHDRALWRRWRNSEDSGNHAHFMFASYGAGPVAILQAQDAARRRTPDPRCWPRIEAVARGVRQRRHEETLAHVRWIEANLSRMDVRGRDVGGLPVVKTRGASSP